MGGTPWHGDHRESKKEAEERIDREIDGGRSSNDDFDEGENGARRLLTAASDAEFRKDFVRAKYLYEKLISRYRSTEAAKLAERRLSNLRRR